MPEDETHVISDADDQLYRQVLDEIKKRMDYVFAHLPLAKIRPDFESCALQLRTAIELVVMGSLVTNREALESIDIALSSKKSADDAAKAAKAANPDYWPKATAPQARAHGEPIELRPVEGALTESGWQREWGKLSAYLHAHNPFKEHLSLDDARMLIARVSEEVRLLTQHHSIHLADRYGMLVGQISPSGVSVTHFALLAAAEAPDDPEGSD
jgi:hypothetical protein